jgi:membrane protease YdiL (CAAX protease family)
MAFVKRHRNELLLVLAFAQLCWLLSMRITWTAVDLLGQALTDGRYVVYILCGPLLLVAGVGFNRWMKELDRPWLEWSPLGVRANIALAPITRRWIGIPYAVLLAACMPLLAFAEELIFRNGTTNWLRGLLWGGLAFGALHLVSFVSLRMAIWIGLAGVILAGLYMTGGLAAVFVTHATYNLLALAMIVVEQHGRLAPRALRRLSARVAAAN